MVLVFHKAAAQQATLASRIATVEKLAVDAWIETASVPEVPAARFNAVSDGVLYKLVDTQVRWQPDGYEYYNRYVFQITERSGLEAASKISEEFDPNDTELAFNFIKVTREGETVDRLSDAEITVLQQEDELDSDILTGNLTALVVLEDVRVGDTIDYAVSGKVQLKLWPGEFFNSIQRGWSVPVGQSRYRLILPSDKDLHIKNFLTKERPEILESDSQKIYSWVLTDPDPIPPEDGTPFWEYAWPTVSMTTMNDWTDIQKWAEPHYDMDQSLPADFEKQVKAIRKNWRKPEDRMTEALRLIQDNIRYVGIEIGLGSHVPRAPAEVVRRGYGDCKDKSVLLVAVLKKLGIKSWPALVHNSAGLGLGEELPSPYAFNHAIVKVKIKDDVFWLDPTLSHQGGRGDTLSQPSYGYGLPIGGKNKGLEPIVDTPPSQATLHVQEDYFVPQDGDTALKLKVTATYRDYEADSQRALIASQALEEFRRSYLNYYQGMYNGLEVLSPINIEDDLDSNILIVAGSFALSKEQAELIELRKKMSMNAWAVRGLFNQPNQTERRTPLAMPYQINRSHQINVHLPGYRPAGIDPTELVFGEGTYSRHFVSDRDTLQINFSVVNDSHSVAAEDAADAVKFAKTINEETNLNYYLDKVAQSYAGQFKLDEAAFAPIEERVTQVLAFIGEKKQAAALKVLNELEREAASKDRVRGLVQTLRAETLIALNRKSLAKTAFQEAIELYDEYANSYFKLAEIFRAEDDVEQEIAILIRLTENRPEDVKKIRNEWLSDLSANLYKAETPELFAPLALALARVEYNGEDEQGAGWIYSRALDALINGGAPLPDTAKSEAAKYLKQVTSPQTLLNLMIDRKYESIWHEVEKWAGSDLRLAMDRYVDEKKVAFEADETSFKKLHAYMYALRLAGKVKNVLQVAQPFIEDWGGIAAEANDAFWVANTYANSLADMGRYDEANEILQRINQMPIGDFPDSISQRINLAIMLQSQARFAEALELAEALDKDYASKFGQMFIDGVRACSLYKLNREDEAQPIFSQMEETKEENIFAFTAVVACFEDDQKLTQVLIDRLENESQRTMALEKFLVGKEAPFTASFDRETMTYVRSIRQSPAVQKVFEKYGRTLEIDGYDSHWGG